MGQKNQDAGDDGHSGGNEDHAGGDVLRNPGQFVEFLGVKINHRLDAGVDHLGDQNEADDKNNDRPLGATDTENKTGSHGQDGKKDVNLKVGLGPESVNHPIEGVPEGNCVLFESRHSLILTCLLNPCQRGPGNRSGFAKKTSLRGCNQTWRPRNYFVDHPFRTPNYYKIDT